MATHACRWGTRCTAFFLTPENLHDHVIYDHVRKEQCMRRKDAERQNQNSRTSIGYESISTLSSFGKSFYDVIPKPPARKRRTHTQTDEYPLSISSAKSSTLQLPTSTAFAPAVVTSSTDEVTPRSPIEPSKFGTISTESTPSVESPPPSPLLRDMIFTPNKARRETGNEPDVEMDDVDNAQANEEEDLYKNELPWSDSHDHEVTSPGEGEDEEQDIEISQQPMFVPARPQVWYPAVPVPTSSSESVPAYTLNSSQSQLGSSLQSQAENSVSMESVNMQTLDQMQTQAPYQSQPLSQPVDSDY